MPVLMLCALLLEKYSYRCIPYRWNLTVLALNSKTTVIDACGGPYKDCTGIPILDRNINLLC